MVEVDLISMADIARMAGQSRAAVGNWKLRNPEDFPPERGRSPRGPLYDRGEVTAWLEATNRLDKRPPEVTAVWHLADQFRSGMTTEDALPFLLVLLAMMSKAPAAEWRQLVKTPPADLDDAIRKEAAILVPFARELLPTGPLPTDAVARALGTLSTLDRPRLSVMADALLEQAAKAMGPRSGEFLSPPSVRRLAVAIVEPVGTVYNPATGAGQLMVEASTAARRKPLNLVGQEMNARTWAMSQLNLAIHDVTADVAQGDVFGEDRFPQLRADRVVCLPPWNQRLPILDDLVDDARWVWGEPGSNDGNAAWIQHCVSHLAEEGRAVIVVPNSALFEGGRSGRIRQRIVKAGLLHAVISLPPGLFSWTGLPCSVLVFVKGRSQVAGKPAPTLMVDLAQSSGPSNGLDDDVIAAVAHLYHGWAAESGTTLPGYAAVASFDDIAANEFVIDPARYRPLPRAVTDLAGARRDRAELVKRLAALSRGTHNADARLRAILEEAR